MICTYCGDIADTNDHIIPVSYRFATRRPKESKYLSVPCCLQCNSTLGDVFLFTVADRSRYLYDTYKEKWKKVLRTADWSEEEINSLGPNLQSKISASVEVSKILKDRLAHCQVQALSEMDWEEAQECYSTETLCEYIHSIKFSIKNRRRIRTTKTIEMLNIGCKNIRSRMSAEAHIKRWLLAREFDVKSFVTKSIIYCVNGELITVDY